MDPTEEDAQLIPVMESGGPLEVPLIVATGLQSVLRGHGIEAVVSGFRTEPVLPFRLLVSSTDAERAGQVIAEALAGGAAAADEAELAGEAAGDLPPDDVNSGSRGLL
jgi:hypothetical protein